MNIDDKKKFAELMALMGETFQKEISKPQMVLYWTLLEKYKFDDVKKGIYNLISSRKITGTIPLPAEIIQAIDNTTGVYSVEEMAELGWIALLWTIEHVGHWRSVMFDDPVIHDVVQALGGWLKINNADNPEWNNENQMQWRRKDFVSLYRIFAKQKSSTPYLIGEQQAMNLGVFDAFVPEIMRITGKPGQYLAIPHERPKELPRPEDFQMVKDLTDRMEM